MIVENNYEIAIASLSHWLQILAPGFLLMTSKTKTNRTLYARFSRALGKLQAIARNSDWFIMLFTPVLVGRSNYFGIGFSTVN